MILTIKGHKFLFVEMRNDWFSKQEFSSSPQKKSKCLTLRKELLGGSRAWDEVDGKVGMHPAKGRGQRRADGNSPGGRRKQVTTRLGVMTCSGSRNDTVLGHSWAWQPGSHREHERFPTCSPLQALSWHLEDLCRPLWAGGRDNCAQGIDCLQLKNCTNVKTENLRLWTEKS